MATAAPITAALPTLSFSSITSLSFSDAPVTITTRPITASVTNLVKTIDANAASLNSRPMVADFEGMNDGVPDLYLYINMPIIGQDSGSESDLIDLSLE